MIDNKEIDLKELTKSLVELQKELVTVLREVRKEINNVGGEILVLQNYIIEDRVKKGKE